MRGHDRPRDVTRTAPDRSSRIIRTVQGHDRIIRSGEVHDPDDYALIAQLQGTGVQAGVVVSKSAVLRAGLHALQALSPADLRQVFAALAKVKPGRPTKR